MAEEALHEVVIDGQHFGWAFAESRQAAVEEFFRDAGWTPMPEKKARMGGQVVPPLVMVHVGGCDQCDLWQDVLCAAGSRVWEQVDGTDAG